MRNLPSYEEFVSESHGNRAVTIAVASDISDYQKDMSREAFDRLVDRVAANLDIHDGSKRRMLADHLANSLPRTDDDPLSKKEVAGLADEIVYGRWMGESGVVESGGVVAADVVQGARFRLRNGLVVSVLGVDPDGYLKTSNAQKQQPDERIAVTSHIGGSGDRQGHPFKDSLRDFVAFLNEKGASPVNEGRVDEYGRLGRHSGRIGRVKDAALAALAKKPAGTGIMRQMEAFKKDWKDMETRIEHSPSALVDRELDLFMREVLANHGLEDVIDGIREGLVGEGYDAIRKALKRAGVSGSSKEDVDGTTVTFRSDADRDAAARAIAAAGMKVETEDGSRLRVAESALTEAADIPRKQAITLHGMRIDYRANTSELKRKLKERGVTTLKRAYAVFGLEVPERHRGKNLDQWMQDEPERVNALAHRVIFKAGPGFPWESLQVSEASRNPVAALREFAAGNDLAALTGIALRRTDEIGEWKAMGAVGQWSVSREKDGDGSLLWFLRVALDPNRAAKLSAKLDASRYEASMAPTVAWFAQRGLRASALGPDKAGDHTDLYEVLIEVK